MELMIDYYKLESLHACPRGLRNFKKHYPNFSGTVGEVMQLEKIPNKDKLWLFQILTGYALERDHLFEAFRSYDARLNNEEKILLALITAEMYHTVIYGGI